MNKIKSTIFIQVLFMMFILCGCGNNNFDYANTSTETQSFEDDDIITEDNTPIMESTTESSVDFDTYDEDMLVDLKKDLSFQVSDSFDTGDSPFIYIRGNTNYKTNENIKRLYTNYKEFLYLAQENDERYAGIKKALDDYNSSIDQTGTIIGKDVLNSASEASASYAKEGVNYTGYYDKGSSYICRLDDNILSIKYVSSKYSGGSNMDLEVYGYVYDVGSGERINISDVVTSIEDLKNAANEVSEKNSFGDSNDSGFKDKLNQCFSDVNSINWNLGPTALNLYFNMNQTSEGGGDTQVLNIRYKDYPSLFNDGYASLEGDWIQNINEMSGNPLMEDVSGDGEVDFINIELLYDGNNIYDYAYTNGIRIATSEEEVSFSVYNYSPELYLAKKNDRYFIYVIMGTGDVQDSIHVFEITNSHINDSFEFNYSMSIPGNAFSSVEEFDQEGFNIRIKSMFYNPQFFYAYQLTYIPTMYSAYSIYNIGDDGSIMPLYGYCKFDFEATITSKMDQSFSEVDEEGNELGIINVPSGTKYKLYRTDTKSYVDYIIDNGMIVRVYIDSSVNPNTVNGVSIYDVFDGI